jgi:hypothetical protein
MAAPLRRETACEQCFTACLNQNPAKKRMHSLADIACFQKWATARLCAAKTDAWQVFALHNLTVAIETTSPLTIYQKTLTLRGGVVDWRSIK